MNRTDGPAPRGVVLAGGESTRFGDADEDKALATVGSSPLLERIIGRLETATGQAPVVVVRTPDQRARFVEHLDHEPTFAFDAAEFRGPVAGLFGAAAAIDAEWLFCCGCDMPLLAVAAVEWLVDRLADEDGDHAPDAVAMRHADGTLEPLHTLYRRSSVARMRSEIPETAGPRTLLARLPNRRTIPIAAVPEGVPMAASMTNVNTVAELKRALRRDDEPER